MIAAEPIDFHESSTKTIGEFGLNSAQQRLVVQGAEGCGTKAEWTTRILADVCTKVTDGSHFSPSTVASGYPYITVRDIKESQIDFTNCAFVEKTAFLELKRNGCSPSFGDILFSKDGTVGKVALVESEADFVVLSSLAILRPDVSLINPKYLSYVLRSPAFVEEAIGKKTGVAIRRIILKNLKQIPVPYPSLPEQQRIVTLLDEAFDGIATAKAHAEKNLQNARDLFGSHLQEIFSRKGEGWAIKSVQQLINDGILAKPQDGNHGEIHPTKADFVDVGVPFIMASDLANGAVNTEDCRFIADTQARTLRIGFAKSGDVLLSHKGTIGRVAVLETNDDYVVLTPQVTYYRSLDSKRLHNGFLYYCLLSPVFQIELNRIADAGSTRAYIGITRQLDLNIALPPISSQHELTLKLRNIQETSNSLVRIYEQKLTALDELKKSLLHRAFNGDL